MKYSIVAICLKTKRAVSMVHKKGFPFPVVRGEEATVSLETAQRKAKILNAGYNGVVWKAVSQNSFDILTIY